MLLSSGVRIDIPAGNLSRISDIRGLSVVVAILIVIGGAGHGVAGGSSICIRFCITRSRVQTGNTLTERRRLFGKGTISLLAVIDYPRLCIARGGSKAEVAVETCYLFAGSLSHRLELVVSLCRCLFRIDESVGGACFGGKSCHLVFANDDGMAVDTIVHTACQGQRLLGEHDAVATLAGAVCSIVIRYLQGVYNLGLGLAVGDGVDGGLASKHLYGTVGHVGGIVRSAVVHRDIDGTRSSDVLVGVHYV